MPGDPAYRIDILDVVAPAMSPADTSASVVVVVSVGPFRVVDGSGAQLADQPSTPRVTQDIALKRTGNHWSVFAVTNR